uniref:Uncharacterized protein n=1 Tax=Plectus sambesii TaxID=2011161 RepID=A0A914VAG7_9BILA
MFFAFLSLFLIFHRLVSISGLPLLMLKTEASQECTLSALLLDGREEDEYCNLMMLLRQRINSPQVQIEESMNENTRQLALDAFNRPNRNVDDIETCPATDSICKLEGNRLCICPSQYVCEPIGDSDVHRCEMLAFFARG